MLSQEPASFSASYDSTTKIISTVIFAVLMVVVVVTRSPIVAGLAVVLVLLSYAYSPRRYQIGEGAIRVQSLMGDAVIAVDVVHEVRRTTADDLQGAIRLFGNGGVFGYYGKFQTTKLGQCTWYVTNRKNTVVVITDVITALLSPDDVDGFIAAVGPTPAVAPAPLPVRTARSRIPLVLGTVVGIAGLAVALVGVFYSPGLPSYSLTANALSIHDRFYPVTLQAAEVDTSRVRVIDWSTDTDWRPVSRTNGFSNSHYHSGWYRTAAGQKIRMYWTGNSQRMVLLPLKENGGGVLLEVEDPDAFVQELQHVWRL